MSDAWSDSMMLLERDENGNNRRKALQIAIPLMTKRDKKSKHNFIQVRCHGQILHSR